MSACTEGRVDDGLAWAHAKAFAHLVARTGT
jgi:hypothetical protein